MLSSNSSVCPPTFFPLDYDAACMSAASLANKTYGGSLSLEAYPAGCFWHTVDGSVYFNAKGASGTVNSFALQLCAGAPIPAPPYAADAAEHGARQGPQGLLSRLVLPALLRACITCVSACMHARLRASLRVCLYALRVCVRTILPPAPHSSIHPFIGPSTD